MAKKFLIPLAATILFTGLTPAVGQADQVANVQKEIERIKKESQAAKGKIGAINQQISSIQAQQQSTKEDIMSIDLKMNETQAKIQELDKKIEETTASLKEAAKQLQEAITRVEKRDKLLKTRVSAIYEAGDISYLEVLLGSQDFSDFLERLDAVKSIVDQDVTILEDNKRDRDIIAEKKKQIEEQLKSLKAMQAEAQQLAAQLDAQKQERERILKELQEQEGELLEIKEEQEKASLELVNQLQAKIEEQRRAEEERRRASSSDAGSWNPPPVHSGGQFVQPVSGRISSPFGYRIHPILHTRKFHDGTDFAAPQGTPIYAAAEGVVASAGYMNGYGNTVVIYHGNGLSTLYGHIRNGGIVVSEGQSVSAGQKIAEVGATGRATGPHLHFTVIKNGQKVDPMSYLR
ncbi:murein hydrolase activator EnvC family protein [Aneurinibacillus aneurinilyticus]|nr:M23 family metallopeptidase [Aneurinibacillus aneurinilyticus]MCI1693929.1 peptidoglycan DD-metalloendopeptidase family protein [Aneurinibacillus aneurinilyticus]MED0706489.1 peptidoglycan DD-metalloendopeptidase family protein [Aneurinibacillus aneurinilyticus]MED0721412.1 peptidoglycan DD-metalloendopeptidase family protein [Aneurinibacillus aneurinilyticus]MED0731138.1 peptidoglycan DD-metalloendopeptidase family protein [Aneurinibacillus aneurinilyticus]MED0743270.1 peptidoglycan DD-met